MYRPEHSNGGKPVGVGGGCIGATFRSRDDPLLRVAGNPPEL